MGWPPEYMKQSDNELERGEIYGLQIMIRFSPEEYDLLRHAAWHRNPDARNPLYMLIKLAVGQVEHEVMEEHNCMTNCMIAETPYPGIRGFPKEKTDE